MKYLAIIVFAVTLHACTVVHRKHRAGWHIEWRGANRSGADDRSSVVTTRFGDSAALPPASIRRDPNLSVKMPEPLRFQPSVEVESKMPLRITPGRSALKDTIRKAGPPQRKQRIKPRDRPYKPRDFSGGGKGAAIVLAIFLSLLALFIPELFVLLGIVAADVVLTALGTGGVVLAVIVAAIIIYIGVALYLRMVMGLFPSSEEFATYGARNKKLWSRALFGAFFGMPVFGLLALLLLANIY
jgi:hypothetical protein